MTTVPHKAAAVDRAPWLDSVAPERRLALMSVARRSRTGAGGAIYRAGDAPSGLYQVLGGHVRLISYPTAGRQLVNLVVPPGDWFGELSTLDGEPRPHDAIAVGQVSVLHLPQRDLDRLGEADPGLYRDIARLACRHQRAALDYIGAMLGRTVLGRLAQTLLAMAERPPGEAPYSLRISQDDLAGPAGLSRQSLNRRLAELEAAGLIRKSYRQILLVDPEGLNRID